ncbi:MAG: type IV toxin-antitoxin system AbiEi family antitoxin domain-containing protein [Nanoarchaeota archaeon]
MKKAEFLKLLGKYPLFTLNEFVRVTGFSPKYAWVCLSRLKKEGVLFQVERGKYTTQDDPMVFASYIIVPSYISFWTALRFHGLTEQLPADIMVASHKPKPVLSIKGIKIRFFKMRHMWGYAKYRQGEFDIFVADKEKAILDSVLLKNVPFDEIAKAITGANPEKLAEYAIKSGNKAAMKRIGYLLDFSGRDAKKLRMHIDSNYIPLDPGYKKTGKRIKEWKIIENRSLHDIN